MRDIENRNVLEEGKKKQKNLRILAVVAGETDVI